MDIVSPLPLGVGLRRILKFLLVYTSCLCLSLWMAYEVRFDFDVPWDTGRYIPQIMGGVVILQLTFLYAFHQFYLLPAYFGIAALLRMTWACLLSGLTVALIRWQFHLGYALPFGVILVDAVLSVVFLSSMCYAWRLYRHDHLSQFFGLRRRTGKRRRRVGIIGAGETGVALAQELLAKEDLGLFPVAFFDDNPGKWRARV